MPLNLKVRSYKGLPPSSELGAAFGPQGGTIGRKAGNTMVLADAENFVSGHHAEISYQNGHYHIKDTSKNGTYLVNAGISLNNIDAVLENHEILRIGEYELLVEVLTDIQDDPILNIENSLDRPFSRPFGVETNPIFVEPINTPLPNEISGAQFFDLPPSSPFQDSFTPPAVMSPSEENKGIAELLKGLDTLGALDAPRPVTEPKPNPIIETPNVNLQGVPPFLNDLPNPNEFPSIEPIPQAIDLKKELPPDVLELNTEKIGTDLMGLFLEGAGIKDPGFLPQEYWPEAMKASGALFRSLIEGLMDVLRARAEMKSEFRVSVTTIRSVDNNPLKFNPDVESVLKLMLSPTNPAFIHPKDAVNEAFKDIKYHQLAMTAGIQASLAEILHRFDPETFEKILGEGILFQKKAKCWELYCEKYPELKSLAQEEFFGEEFADAYEKQMRLFTRR